MTPQYYIDAEDDFWRQDDDGSWWFHDGPWRHEGYAAPGALPGSEVRHDDPEAQPLRLLTLEEGETT